jgi:serine/threonine-protein kinase
MAAVSAQTPRTVGRYVLFGEIASGGMATVHVGRLSGPVGFSRTVAIKRLHPQFAKDPDFVAMFLDEARLVGRIRHPNVVPTLDVVALPDEVFLVMEYVPGEAFSRLLKNDWLQGNTSPPRVSATIVSSVLHGLHAAHVTKDEQGSELGIVHRDVSPQNVLVGVDGVARVLDFGVAKAAGRLQTTRDGQVKGKLAYMPPEQLNGGAVTCQTDVYAAAVVLWEALAGRRLFDGETEALVLMRVLEGRIEPPSAFNPHVDAAMDAVVMRGLSRDPAHRYATAREMAVAIEQTIGLASPSLVSDWVERAAGPEIARRAATIAEVESASLAGVPLAVTVTGAPPESPHSQVSSISVSRPAVSLAPPPPIHRAAKLALAGAFAFALAGVTVGAYAVPRLVAKRSASAANAVAREARRSLVVTSAPGLARQSEAARDDAVKDVTPARRMPARAAPAPKTSGNAPQAVVPSCDQPFTIDSNGRKKYKRECLNE